MGDLFISSPIPTTHEQYDLIVQVNDNRTSCFTYGSNAPVGQSCYSQAFVTVSVAFFLSCPSDQTIYLSDGSTSVQVTWQIPQLNDVGQNLFLSGDFSVANNSYPGSLFELGTTIVSYSTSTFADNQTIQCNFQVTVGIGAKILTHGIGSRRSSTALVNYVLSSVDVFGGGTFTSTPIWADISRDTLSLEVMSDSGNVFQVLANGNPLGMQSLLTLCITGRASGGIRVPVAASIELTGLAALQSAVASTSNTSATTNNTSFSIPLQISAQVDESCVYINASAIRDVANVGAFSFQSALITISIMSSVCLGNAPLARCNSTNAKSLDAPRVPQPLLFSSSTTNFISFYLRQASSQSLFIFLQDTTPPTVEGCPGDQTVVLPFGLNDATLSWIEPRFSDNVGVQAISGPFSSVTPGGPVSLTVSPSNSPLGIVYSASDAAGNTVQCSFVLSVDYERRGLLSAQTMSTTIQSSLRPFARRRRRAVDTEEESDPMKAMRLSSSVSTSTSIPDSAAHPLPLEKRAAPPSSPPSSGFELNVVVNNLDLSKLNVSVTFNASANEVVVRLSTPTGLRVVVPSLPDNVPAVNLQLALELVPSLAACGSPSATNWVTQPLGDEFTLASLEDLRDLLGNPLQLPYDALSPSEILATASTASSFHPLRWLSSDPRTAVASDASYMFMGGNGDTFSSGFTFSSLTIRLDFPLGRAANVSCFNNNLRMNLANSLVAFNFYYPAEGVPSNFQLVAIRDFDPPRWVNCPGNIAVNASTQTSFTANGASTVSWTSPTPTDNIAVSFSNSTALPGSTFAITFPPASTPVVYEAFDAAMNMGICSFNVQVIDVTPPSLSCPSVFSLNYTTATALFPFTTSFPLNILENSANVVVSFNLTAVSNASGLLGQQQVSYLSGTKNASSLAWDWQLASSSFAESVLALKSSSSSSNSFSSSSSSSTFYATLKPGNYALNTRVADLSGNVVKCNTAVQVKDYIAPTFSNCIPTTKVTVFLAPDSAYNVTWTTPTANDNDRITSLLTYDGNGVEQNTTFAVINLGSLQTIVYSLKFVAKDASGNNATCLSSTIISNVYLTSASGTGNNNGNGNGNTDSSSSSSSLSIPLVAGVIGGVVLLAIIIIVLLRRHQLRKKPADFSEFLTRLEAVMKIDKSEGPRKPREISREHIKIISNLGKGQFGTVDKAILDEKQRGVPGYLCAVKQLLSVAAEDMTALMEESSIMAQLDSNFCVRLIGVVTVGKPMMMVVEYCEMGALNSYLQKHQDIGEDQRRLFAGDCAEGLLYLSNMGFIHRDVAARNVLVSSELRCKISDFGMSREADESDYYHSRGGALPVRWCAPEVLEHRKYSPRSDIYAAGILFYEIWTKGATPYGNEWKNQQVWVQVTAGYRLPQPEGCAEDVYNVMYNCWQEDPKKRPTAEDLVAFFRKGISPGTAAERVRRSTDQTRRENDYYHDPTVSPGQDDYHVPPPQGPLAGRDYVSGFDDSPYAGHLNGSGSSEYEQPCVNPMYSNKSGGGQGEGPRNLGVHGSEGAGKRTTVWDKGLSGAGPSSRGSQSQVNPSPAHYYDDFADVEEGGPSSHLFDLGSSASHVTPSRRVTAWAARGAVAPMSSESERVVLYDMTTTAETAFTSDS